jgi:hypothetical protein
VLVVLFDPALKDRAKFKPPLRVAELNCRLLHFEREFTKYKSTKYKHKQLTTD